MDLDIIAGSVLMRVRQKKENREYQRNLLLNDNACPRYSSDLNRVFNTQCPSWMTLKNAQHFFRFAVSSYGWPLLCAIAPCRSCCGIMRKITCCANLRYNNCTSQIKFKSICHLTRNFSILVTGTNQITLLTIIAAIATRPVHAFPQKLKLKTLYMRLLKIKFLR